MKLRAISKDRYRATAAERRLYGGATVTDFYVWDEHAPKRKSNRADLPDYNVMITVRGFGKTPGERKTNAIESAIPRFRAWADNCWQGDP